MKALAKGHAGFSVIEHYTSGEAVSSRLFEFVQSTKVSLLHRCCRLDFHASDSAGWLLNDDIHLRAVLVSEMEEFRLHIVPACLSSQFLKHKRFQKMSQQSSIRRQRPGIGAEHGRGEAGIGEMQLRTLDQSRQAVAVPGGDPFQHEKPLAKRDVVLYGSPAEFKG